MREAFYRYRTKETTLMAGLHSMKSPDHFLINERALGASVKHAIGPLEVNINAAAFKKDFARMGNFCGVRYLYNTAHPTNEILPGEAIGETNATMLTLIWNHQYVKPVESSTEDEFKPMGEDEFKPVNEDEFKPVEEDEFKEVSEDEFKSTDEFGEFDEFSSFEEEKSKLSIKDLFTRSGVYLYDEFGYRYEKIRIYYGAYTSISLPAEINLDIQVIHQLVENSQALGYFAKARKSVSWSGANRSSFSLGYFGRYSIDEGAWLMPGFSNYYMGEIIRFDIFDAPLALAEIKQNFSGDLKPYIRVRGVQLLHSSNTTVADLEAGLFLLKHIRLTGIFSFIQSEIFENPKYMARFEMRGTF